VSDFNNDPFGPPPGSGDAAAVPPVDQGATAAATPAATETPLSPAFARFRSCRWQQPIENGSPEFCTHREVKPYAGTTGFDPEAWCGDCQHYKLRRAPKKRPAQSDDWNY
jgi:hypothetical protein